ncbi:putative citrate synthase [Nemania sp. FL0916]|nr:putative citrate synthase [Nemania sp. FL0916]
MDSLHIVDSRTGNNYTVTIQNNYIKAIDIRKITAPRTGIENGDAVRNAEALRILDNGLQNTAVMKSSITLVDGHKGLIKYRDLHIEQLFHDFVYEDVMHLIIWGKLPQQKQKDEVRAVMNKAMTPIPTVIDVISSFPRDAEICPMILAGMCAFMAADETMGATRREQKPTFHGNLGLADQALQRTIAYLATTIALVHCHKVGIAFTPPEPGRSLIGNLLLMMGVQDSQMVERCLDKLWILYADHELTNSTAATLHAGSTLTDPVSAIISGIISGFGPLHGGAINLAYDAFRLIGAPENVPAFIDAIKARKGRLFGYGHRIYKTRDPRVALIQELMQEYRTAVDANPLLRIAMAVDKVANQDPYFVDRGLKANADLLGCFLYKAMGFDDDMIMPIIILSRVPGVLAHWRESLTQPVMLWRSQQIYEPEGTIHAYQAGAHL